MSRQQPYSVAIKSYYPKNWLNQFHRQRMAKYTQKKHDGTWTRAKVFVQRLGPACLCPRVQPFDLHTYHRYESPNARNGTSMNCSGKDLRTLGTRTERQGESSNTQ